MRSGSIALTAVLVLSVAAGLGRASRGIGFNTGGRSVTMTTEQLTFEMAGSSVRCPVTLTGTFFSGTEKVEWAPAERITGASIGSCTGGSARFLTETLPWYSSYNSFAGTLPRITSVNLGIDELAALVEALGIGCLFRGVPRGSTGPSGEVTEFRLDETVRVPIATRLSAFCPSEGKVYGTFRVSPTITLSLMEAILGSSVNMEPNPLIVSSIKERGTITVTAVGGAVGAGTTHPIQDPGRPGFTSSGCVNVLLAEGTSCTVTVAPFAGAGNRPTSGRVMLTYSNERNIGRGWSVTVRIE